MRAAAEDDLLAAFEGFGRRGDPRPRKFQPVQAEGQLGRAEDNWFHFGNRYTHDLARLRKSFVHARRIRRANQARNDVALIGDIARFEAARALIEFEELEARDRA